MGGGSGVGGNGRELRGGGDGEGNGSGRERNRFWSTKEETGALEDNSVTAARVRRRDAAHTTIIPPLGLSAPVTPVPLTCPL